MSRGPVREAFRALEESGLVRLEKNRGVFVRQIAVDEADEIYELRAVLDEFVGRRVAQTATPDDVAELRARVERMERAARAGDVDAYHQANLEFHDRLVELAGNAKLLVTYRRLVNELHLLPPRHAGAGRHAAGLARASTARSSTASPPAQAAAAGRALLEHVMASRERMHRTRTGSARPGRAKAAPARGRAR